jgi:hypothetical protein
MDDSIVLWKALTNREGESTSKFTDDQPFEESLQAIPNLRKDHLRR